MPPSILYELGSWSFLSLIWGTLILKMKSETIFVIFWILLISRFICLLKWNLILKKQVKQSKNNFCGQRPKKSASCLICICSRMRGRYLMRPLGFSRSTQGVEVFDSATSGEVIAPQVSSGQIVDLQTASTFLRSRGLVCLRRAKNDLRARSF